MVWLGSYRLSSLARLPRGRAQRSWQRSIRGKTAACAARDPRVAFALAGPSRSRARMAEINREASDQCIAKAKSAIDERDLDKATRMVEKSLKLYPNVRLCPPRAPPPPRPPPPPCQPRGSLRRARGSESLPPHAGGGATPAAENCGGTCKRREISVRRRRRQQP